MNKISERIKNIKNNIAAVCENCKRAPAEVKLVVVTKSTTIENIQKVVRLGFTELGENRVRRLKRVSAEIAEFAGSQGNSSAIPEKINWHMIGHLQRNKVRQVIQIASLIHSVDTLRLAEEINNTAAKNNLHPSVLLQVNTSNEPQKYGVPVGAAVHMAEQIETMAHLKLAGLMTMAPLTHNKQIIKDCFARSKELFLEIQCEKIAGPQFTELSMGMSSDYEIAVEQGATILRIGSAIFSS